MKKLFFSLVALCLALNVGAQSTSDRTSFYLLPEGSFYAGMTSSGALSTALIYMPCYADSSHIFCSTTGAGDWQTNGTVKAADAEKYDYKMWIGYYSANVPVLTSTGKQPYQYGSQSSTKRMYSASGTYNLMTNAREWCDTTAKASGQAQTLYASYKTTAANVDTMGAYFYNSHPLMVKGISIPINSNKTGQTVDNLFPNENSHVTVNVYAAKATPKGDGTYSRSINRSKKLVETIILTKKDFSVNSSTAYRGALNCTFDQPILTTEPFVVEVSEFKTCGEFYFYADNYCKNYTSFYMRNDTMYTSSKGNLLFAVNAYFPAAQPMQRVVVAPAVASTASVQMYTNTKYNSADWTVTVPDWVESFTVDTTGGNATMPVFTFSVKENPDNFARMDTVWFEMLGYRSYIFLNQNKPETFIMPIGPATEGIGPAEGGVVRFGDADELLLLTNISSEDIPAVECIFPRWMTGTFEVLSADTLRITATVEKNTLENFREDIVIISGDLTFSFPVSQDKWIGYIKTSSSETGFKFQGQGGQMKFEHYSNTEMFFQSNVPYSEWQITKPDWITEVVLKDTLRSGTPSISMILYAAANMGSPRSDSITIMASEDSFLKFGLQQDSLIRKVAYYTIDNCLYRGFGPKRAVYTTPYIYVPYCDSVAVRLDSPVAGSWYSNGKLQEGVSDVYYTGPISSNVNTHVLFMPEFQPADSLVYMHYQYGGKYYTKSRIRFGNGNKDYVCPASLYADTTETASGQGYWQRSGTISGVTYDYSYGTGLGAADDRYDTIGQFIPLSDVFTFDTVYVPLYNKAKEGKETIFGANGKLTLSVYYAELDEAGVPVVDRENPLAVMVADSNAWMPNDNYPYYGTLTFRNVVTNRLGIESVKPIVAEKSIYCEFTGFNETGMEFGFYSDGYTNVKPNAWFTKGGKQNKVWGTQHNIFLSLYGFFPMMVNWDEIEGLTVVGEGGTAQVSDSIYAFSLRANHTYTEWDVDAPDWVSISYDDIQFMDNNIVAIEVQADRTDEAREGDIVFSNHGKSVTIHISQASPVSGLSDMYGSKDQAVRKLIRDGRLYIIRGGKTYDAVGVLVE